MNRFEKFLGKEKEVQIDGLTFIVKALKVKDFGLVMDFEDPSKREQAEKQILERIVRDSFGDLTAEELASIAEWTISKVSILIEAFVEVNGFEESAKKAEFLEKIRKAQNK